MANVSPIMHQTRDGKDKRHNDDVEHNNDDGKTPMADKAVQTTQPQQEEIDKGQAQEWEKEPHDDAIENDVLENSSGDEDMRHWTSSADRRNKTKSEHKLKREAILAAKGAMWCARSSSYRGGGYCDTRVLSGSLRMKAYTLGGDQVGLLGIGNPSLHKPFGTLPGEWDVGSILNMSGWVKVLCEPVVGETPKEGRHYEIMDPKWKPKTVVFAMKPGRQSIIGVPMDKLGSYEALYLQLLITEAKIEPRSMQNIFQEYNESVGESTTMLDKHWPPQDAIQRYW